MFSSSFHLSLLHIPHMYDALKHASLIDHLLMFSTHLQCCLSLSTSHPCTPHHMYGALIQTPLIDSPSFDVHSPAVMSSSVRLSLLHTPSQEATSHYLAVRPQLSEFDLRQ